MGTSHEDQFRVSSYVYLTQFLLELKIFQKKT